MNDEITFFASFPPIQSAIKITGNGDGMRIQLDIPESEMGEAVKLLLLRQCVLQVKISPELQAINRQNGKESDKFQTRPVRKSERKAAERAGLN